MTSEPSTLKWLSKSFQNAEGVEEFLTATLHENQALFAKVVPFGIAYFVVFYLVEVPA